jgi:hypothetical protein
VRSISNKEKGGPPKYLIKGSLMHIFCEVVLEFGRP